jgi:hypothetical protein
MKEISAALVKAQKEFGPALKTHTNPAFRSKYAGLDACIEAVLDALNNNGIFLMQPTHECEGGVIVETLFIHESGEQMSSGKLHVPATKLDAQGYGSALTYARRYSLMTACGIAPEDDDGNAASKPAPKTSTPAPKAAAPVNPPTKIAGKEGEWQLKVSTKPDADAAAWIDIVKEATNMMLSVAKTKDDVLNIFKNNRNIFDQLKLVSEDHHKDIMDSFTTSKKSFEEAK